MRHVTVSLIFIAQYLAGVCNASSSYLSNVNNQDALFFRQAEQMTQWGGFGLSDTATSKARWCNNMVLTMRGGSPLDLSVPQDGELCDLPDQVDERAIQMLVDEIIADKNTNILLLPDNIEAGLYRNTVRMTLNAIFNVLKDTDGRRFLLGHKFKLRHYPATMGKTEAFRRAAETSNVNMKVLEEVADHLLQNKNINQPLIPDVLERQIYVNCLKVVMRVLDVLHGSLRITFCGHTIGLSLHDSKSLSSIPSESNVRRASSIISKITREDLQRYQKEAGVMEEPRGWFSFFGKQKRVMINQVHATMFGLVVQIVQDMLDQSTIELVGVGKVVMDLVPTSANETDVDETSRQLQPRPMPPISSPRKKPLSTFVSGMGFGAILVVLLLKQMESSDVTIDLGQLTRNLQQHWSTLCARVRSIAQGLVKGLSGKNKDENQVDEPPSTKKNFVLPNPFRQRDSKPDESLPDTGGSEASSSSNTK